MLLLSSKFFLQLFQTNNPMVSFLEYAVVDVPHTSVKMVVDPDVFDQANSSLELSKFWIFQILEILSRVN